MIVSRRVAARCRRRGHFFLKRLQVRSSLRHGCNCRVHHPLADGRAFAYSWHKRKTHRDRSDSLSSVPCFEHPAFQAPVGAGLSIQRRGRPAVALRNLPHAISRAADTISHFVLRPLRELRQPGIATHRREARAGRACCLWADPEIAGAALRSVPSQILFRAAVATRKTSYSARPEQVVDSYLPRNAMRSVRASFMARSTKTVPQQSPRRRYDTPIS